MSHSVLIINRLVSKLKLIKNKLGGHAAVATLETVANLILVMIIIHATHDHLPAATFKHVNRILDFYYVAIYMQI